MDDEGDTGAEEPSLFGTSLFDDDDNQGCSAQQACTEAVWLSDDVKIEIDSARFACWGSARYLAVWLLTEEGRSLVAGRFVLEVGAGLGLPSIACAIAGAERATATDKCSGCLDGLRTLRDERYCDAPWAARVEMHTLDWDHCAQPGFEPQATADIIIAADCHYYSAALQPLVATIISHQRPGGLLLLASKEGRISLDESKALLVRKGFEELRRIEFEDAHSLIVYRAP